MIPRPALAPRGQRPAQLGQARGLHQLRAAVGQRRADIARQCRVARHQDQAERHLRLGDFRDRPALEGQDDPELAALLRPALDADFAAHDLGQLAHDGEAQTRAAKAPIGRAIGLRETLEDGFLRLGRNANAGVGHAEAQHAALGIVAFETDAQRDMAFLGELHRVGDQIGQNLAQMLAAATQRIGGGPIHMDDQSQAFAFGLWPQNGDEVGELDMEIEIDDVDRHLAGFDLGEIEDLVDQREKRATGAGHRAGHVALFAIEAGILEQVAHADDGVERRAQFMAHDRQEAALGQVGLFGLGLGLGQFADQGRDIGGQHDKAGHQAEGQMWLALPIFGGQGHRQETRRADDRG